MSAAVDLQIFENLPEVERARALAYIAQSRNGHGPAGSDDGLETAVYVPQPIAIADLLQRNFPPLQWLVTGMIAKGHLAMLGGRPKSGKSWLLLQLAMAIDQGRPFLGCEVQRGRVLYVALEDGERRVYQRCQLLKWQPTAAAVLFDIAMFDSDGGPGPGVEQIARLATDYDLIIIDTLIKTLSGRANENDNVQMGAIVNELARIAHEVETAVFLSHHTGKGNAENVFDLLRGASALRGAYDVGMLLERKQNEREAILHMESRDVEVSNLTICQAENGAGWECLGNGREIENIRAGREIVSAIMQHGEGLTAKELAEATGKSEQTIRNQLNGAERRSLVWQDKEKREGVDKKVSVWYLVDGLSI